MIAGWPLLSWQEGICVHSMDSGGWAPAWRAALHWGRAVSLSLPQLDRVMASMSPVLVLDQHCPDFWHPAKGELDCPDSPYLCYGRIEASLGKSGEKRGC